ncbi:hypothetical protein ACFVFF_38710 [Streptomyces sp. NPDC057680]|uniref:hypothetical protein n=1 Tax=Streptomyces sp. NPDC057680 TaxID=3346208 RepID=UPI0036A088CA
MIRLPSSHAAVTAPLVATGETFPGIPVGRSLLDGRQFRLSPVMTSAAVLPSTNSLALGGLGSGKSTTGKVRIAREIRDNDHQAVVIDSFGENGATGEWRPIVESLGGRVVQAGAFRLNPCSELFAPAVREQLVRSLILAVEPDALTTQSTHALQHALSHPKATSLNGMVDALVSPEDGRWPAARLAAWGENVAMALSRYTEGALTGLFDGEDAGLPETDHPIVSFDFTGLDRNSPAIPALMAAISCWAEHVWLPQSTAVHRHLVLEEAWQILLSPATASLIQRQLKNSRKAALSLDVLMHTLSDLGDGPARDLARLCEVVHVGRLGPTEAAAVGAILGLPDWAIAEIPSLDPGQAVWKVGPHYVDIIETVLTGDEAALTDTSSRRRAAQRAHIEETPDETPTPAAHTRHALDEDIEEMTCTLDDSDYEEERLDLDDLLAPDDDGDHGEGEWDWDMPPNVTDHRHAAALAAAREGRCNEAADLAALGEREDITTHGITSTEALAWMETRAQVADLCGSPDRAVQLRATVARMANDPFWLKKPDTTPAPAWHATPSSYETVRPADGPPTPPESPQPAARRRRWLYVVVVAALALTAATILQANSQEEAKEQRQAVAAAYKGRSGAKVGLSGVDAEVVAQWSSDRRTVSVELRSYFDRNAKYLRIDADGRTVSSTGEDGWYPKSPDISVPVADPLADVTVRVAVGGRDWKPGTRSPSREIRLSPNGVAYDAETGERLPSDL